MEIFVLQDLTTWLADTTHWSDALQTMHWHFPVDLAALGDKEIHDDLGPSVQRAINNFVKSGQVWAFLIGLFVGYIFRSFTSYG